MCEMMRERHMTTDVIMSCHVMPCHLISSHVQRPFFGGRRQCEEIAQENADGEFKPEELQCGACVSGKDINNCQKHGQEYLEYK